MFLGGPNRKLYCTDTNTPSLFFPINITQDCPNHTKLNLTDFYIPQSSYKTINFTSRDPWWVKEEGGNLKGYLVQVNLSNPYIILSQKDGVGLIVASMMIKLGYNVLLLDLRNHGDSDSYKFQKPYITYGSEEHKDILGAFDYIRNISSSDVGLFGFSMGANSVLIAASKEPRIKAVIADSPPCNVHETISSVAKSQTGINGDLIIFQSCAFANLKSKFGCVPFENDCFQQVSKIQAPVHFEHTSGDIVVPENVVEKTIALMKSNVSFHFEKNTCKTKSLKHCWNILLDYENYKIRISKFLNQYLPLIKS